MSSHVTDPALIVAVDPGASAPLETNQSTLEVSDSFELLLQGCGGPAHVHCRLRGELAAIARIPQPNYYVEPRGETIVPIRVASVTEPVSGQLEVSTGYGAASVTIDVTVHPDSTALGIDIDESLTAPNNAPAAPKETPLLTTIDPGTAGVVALGACSVLIAAATAAVVGGTAAIVGFFIVTIGVVVAAALLIG